MANSNSIPRGAATHAHVPPSFRRLYRAHIGADPYGSERTAFVEAASHRAAIRKIANAVAALEMRLPETVEERIYNCSSAQELVDGGVSEDLELRLLETGCSGSEAISFVQEPLFLTTAPSLIRKWAQVAEVSHG